MKGICISKEATIQELKAVELPEKTQSYNPVSHDWVVDYVENNIADSLKSLYGYELKSNHYGLSRHGQYLFGMASFENGRDDIGSCIAYRNSYNKFFSVGFAFGAQVFVCENGMLTGELIVAKKHTMDVYEGITERVGEAIGMAKSNFDLIGQAVDSFKECEVSENMGFQVLGYLRGVDALGPRVYEKALEEFKKPTYEEHKDGSLMQVYNSCTEALKIVRYPNKAINYRLKLHEEMLTVKKMAFAKA